MLSPCDAVRLLAELKGVSMESKTVYAAIDSLLDYAKNCELLHPLDGIFARNSLLAELKLESYERQKEHYIL